MKRCRAARTLLFLLFCGLPLYAQDFAIPRGHFSSQFRDVEIQDFLKTMAQITKRNILIDENVKGKITIVSYKPIPVSRALDFLKQVLEVKGFAVVEEANLLKVMPIKDAHAMAIPEKRDPDSNAADTITRVIRLPNNANLAEISQTVTKLAGKNTSVIAHRQTNSLVVTGYAQNVRTAVEVIKELIPGGTEEAGDVSTSSVHIYHCKHMKAETLADVLAKLDSPDVGQAPAAAPGTAPAARPAQKIKAVAHKESNSVIVTATQEEWAEILQIVESLDRNRRQILLEVLIAEISSENLNDFGIDWRYQGRNAAHSQFNTGLAVEGNMVDTETGKITGNNTLSGFSLGFLKKGGDLLGIFNANMRRSNFNVLSAPQILTLDNQEAEINVGQDVPVRTQERTSGGGTSEATVNSFEYRPSGIKLKVTPYINQQNKITLDLYQEVTNIANIDSANTNPTFNKRTIKTYINLDNKQTIVIGGLVNTEKQQNVSKIPLLGDIPVLGFLFRRATYSTKKTNLMVFITPHVLIEKGEADRISNFKRIEQIRNAREAENDLKLWPQRKERDYRERQQKQLENN